MEALNYIHLYKVFFINIIKNFKYSRFLRKTKKKTGKPKKTAPINMVYII